jgi:hypothetical protein
MPWLRQLWDRSWQSVLRHSQLDHLSAALTAANEAGSGGALAADDFHVQLRSTPLYQAFIRAAEALVSASKAQVIRRMCGEVIIKWPATAGLDHPADCAMPCYLQCVLRPIKLLPLHQPGGKRC